ncbi:YbjN domain-containing protein [Phenylobacterium sp. Root700]|uniref:YbjN domain-containing protein n=1 Tax=Phenylobacterium sp. Root700 TaxID=1736591 RepID=UPI000ABAB2F0|nr:YbjN domain-containing protein [Phenylobacterium sp. Root700]
MRALLLAASVAALVGLGDAQAVEFHKDGMTAKEVQSWLTDSGYKAEMAKDTDGDSYLKSASDGVSFDVHLYDCKKDRCASMQFIAGFDLDEKLELAKVNTWNEGKRYVDCFLDDEGDPWFTYDANVSPGGSREALDDDFAVWLSFVPDMKELAGWK